MQLDTQQIEDIVEGKLSIPALRCHHFYAELDKIFIKAKADNNFIYIKEPINLCKLEDGRYVSDHYLIFKDQGELMIFHREAGYEDTLKATPGFHKLMLKFFKPVNPGEKIEQHAGVYIARLLRSYLHVFAQPLGDTLTLMQAISDEDFATLEKDFKQLRPTCFETLEALESSVASQMNNSPTIKIIEVEGVYTAVVEESHLKGFQIMVGQHQGDYVYSFLSKCPGQANLDMKQLYEKLTNQPLPNELKRIIAYAYKLAIGNTKHEQSCKNTCHY